MPKKDRKTQVSPKRGITKRKQSQKSLDNLALRHKSKSEGQAERRYFCLTRDWQVM